jgi:outer membrane protein TolC
MNNKLHRFLPAILIFSSACLNGQEIYSLQRCIKTGLERNFSILVARNREEISTRNLSLGNAGFLPSLDLSGRYGGTMNTTTQKVAATGVTSTAANIYNTTATGNVTLGWTLFQGFSAHTSYRKLNELKLIGELNTQLAIEDYVADVVSEYYFYIQQLRLFHNLGYAVSLSRERVRIDAERYLLGASSKLQLLQSQVYLNSDSSRYAKQNEVLRSSQVRLNKLMAAEDLGANLVLHDSVISINPSLVYDSLLLMTDGRNITLQIARRNKTISGYDFKLIAARSYPYLNVSSGYSSGYNTYESSTLLNQKVNGMNYGLTLGINLFDGFNAWREKANARVEIENKEYQYLQVDQQIKGDLITIYFAYQNNLLLLKLEEQNLKTAEENLYIALERYKLGSLSGLELREVQQSLLEAEERLLSVQYQTKLAELSLQQIAGNILIYL